jgi:GTPase SAR1 family protein
MLCATSLDGSVSVWNDVSQATERTCTLVHHSRTARGAAFSFDEGLLATSSMDGTVLVWRTSDWSPVEEFPEPTSDYWPQNIVYHPRQQVLATLGERDRVVRIWDVDAEGLLGLSRGTTGGSLQKTSLGGTWTYRNAKVVLLGDTGVGKTGLRLALCHEEHRPTESTYGRRAWTLETSEFNTDVREILLWDFAGQPGHRIIHQLHLKEVAIALLVFDARRATGDPLSAVQYWHRALVEARQRQDTALPLREFLVLARIDIEGLPVSNERLKAVLHDWGLHGYFETSAKDGRGIEELLHAIRRGIDWNAVPTVVIPELLALIKEFLVRKRKALAQDISARVLEHKDELFREFENGMGDPSLAGEKARDEFEVCLSRLENQDVVRLLSFGGYVLLRPEFLDAYTRAIVLAAEAGDGSVPVRDVLEGRVAVPEEWGVPDKGHESLLFRATLEELVSHQLALREDVQGSDYLVFPAQFRRDWPGSSELKWHTASLVFQGPVLNVYAILVVRLAHSGAFSTTRDDLWRNRAVFTSDVGGGCGIDLVERGNGSAEIRIFSRPDSKGRLPEASVQQRFEAFVLEHLEQRANHGTVERTYHCVCPQCGETYPELWARARRAENQSEIDCPANDGGRIRLSDSFDRGQYRPDVVEMDSTANKERDRDVGKIKFAAKEEMCEYDVFFCYNRANSAAVGDVYQILKDRGIRAWMDEFDLRPGDKWAEEIGRLIGKQARTAAVFVGTDPGPTQQDEIAALRQRTIRIIPVLHKGIERMPDWSTLLEARHSVYLGSGRPDPIEQLYYGITGHR